LLRGRRSAILGAMKRGAKFLAAIFLLACSASLLLSRAAGADELKLKDGSKITGTIVGFEENSFKVKTSYGYAVVQKDQVVTISMSDAPAKPDSEKKPEPATEKPAAPPKPAKTEIAVTSAPAAPSATASKAPASIATGSNPPAPADPTKTAKKETANASAAAATAPAAAPPSKPVSAPASTAATANSASALAAGAAATPPAAASATPSAAKNAPPVAATKSAATVTTPAPAPAPAKPAGPPPVREEVSGNSYVNDTYGFRMYKPPGWDLIAGARAIMPGALAALGTSDERTYLMIGLAPAGETLTDSIDQAEQRLREAMASFRLTDQKRLMVSGVSSIAHRFRGSVDQHEWSGVVVFVPLGAHIYTIFGMTYAESDLVQIQENVINRAITSLQFSKN
jgi:hypothetical protein